MEIDINCEDEEDKKWLDENLDSVLHEAIFELGATVIVDGAYWVIKGHNNPYHTPKKQIKEDNAQTKLVGGI